ncbi:hypothetical protein IDSA_08250 [Pseudidiomarina salinarum]|uniref:Uncharacterized protein n=1 Tax=Pseudidiomarina salinarum TaxID=435908 RepID=A0A094ITR5_9GAMM|nr:hypothetical protein [Pseudidiomarina salinarum]KFZ30522.1 hypothetical protein IDSA_08250 [Pseudidiomarina salinarum]RUO69032.1 hypothetical protein CWI79_08945 [Pseudidiomarina salinarum]
MKATLFLLPALFSLVVITPEAAEINLAKAETLGCISLDEISNSNSPAEIFGALTLCMDKQDYQSAAALYTVGTLYAVYDTKRVADESAHQAISLLRMYALSGRPEGALEQLQAEVSELLTDNTEVCKDILKRGKPTYRPTYMTEYSTAERTDSNPEPQLVEDFNEQEAWRDSLAIVPHC